MNFEEKLDLIIEAVLLEDILLEFEAEEIEQLRQIASQSKLTGEVLEILVGTVARQLASSILKRVKGWQLEQLIAPANREALVRTITKNLASAVRIEMGGDEHEALRTRIEQNADVIVNKAAEMIHKEVAGGLVQRAK